MPYDWEGNRRPRAARKTRFCRLKNVMLNNVREVGGTRGAARLQSADTDDSRSVGRNTRAVPLERPLVPRGVALGRPLVPPDVPLGRPLVPRGVHWDVI